jgi:hypothetical protein
MPKKLSAPDALKMIRGLAADSKKVLVVPHGKERTKERKITRRQVMACIRKGTITEGPFLNKFGNWQVNLYRHAAGENITCTVAIEWGTRLIVVTAFWDRG